MKSIVLNFECSVTKVKVMISLGGDFQGLCHAKEVCKLRFENGPHSYCSKDIEQILQPSVKRKPK